LTSLPSLLSSIAQVSAGRNVVVALSGGIDSSLVLFLAVQACGREKVLPVHVDWGIYTYQVIPKNVGYICQKLGLEPIVISGQSILERVLRNGPACNRCTRIAKLGLIRKKFPEYPILTGANQSDSWGSRGEPFLNNIFAPLFYLTKEEIHQIVRALPLGIEPVGESKIREGCKAKHLLKPLISPNFHGRVAAETNELLLKFLKERGKEVDLANVKIIGPLSENIALVNVLPPLFPEEEEELKKELFQIEGLARVEFVNSPFRLTVVVNPAIYYDFQAQKAISQGILSPAFAFPLQFRFIKSENKRLYSFHVVKAEKL
jgi:uncharacterized protein